MRMPCWSLQKLGGGAGAGREAEHGAGRGGALAGGALPVLGADVGAEVGVERAAGVAGGVDAGDGGGARSVDEDAAASRPLPASQPVAGAVPMPTTSASHAIRSPSSSSTR